MKKFVIVDGYAFIFRAFYAVKHTLSTSANIPTNAVLGFVQLFLRIKSRIRPDNMLVVFDSGGATFRDELYPKYKANRAETPPLLIPQFDICKEALNAMDIPFTLLNGFEADDLIATYANLATKQGFLTHILSYDKDLMQLIEDNLVEMYDESKEKTIRTADVVAKFGIKPCFIRDYLAIVGDSSDNVPGVKGLGPKNAVNLINKFGILEDIYSNISKIPENIAIKLTESQHEAFLSKTLVSLNSTILVQQSDISSFKNTDFNFEKLVNFLRKYELNAVLNSVIRDYQVTVNSPSLKGNQGDLF